MADSAFSSIKGSDGVQDLTSNFTMGSERITDQIPHLVERSSEIIDPHIGIHTHVCSLPTFLNAEEIGVEEWSG